MSGVGNKNRILMRSNVYGEIGIYKRLSFITACVSTALVSKHAINMTFAGEMTIFIGVGVVTII